MIFCDNGTQVTLLFINVLLISIPYWDTILAETVDLGSDCGCDRLGFKECRSETNNMPGIFQSDFSRQDKGTQRSVVSESVQTVHIEEIHDIPLKVLLRPIKPVFDLQKLESLMDAIKVNAFFRGILSYYFNQSTRSRTMHTI